MGVPSKVDVLSAALNTRGYRTEVRFIAHQCGYDEFPRCRSHQVKESMIPRDRSGQGRAVFVKSTVFGPTEANHLVNEGHLAHNLRGFEVSTCLQL